METGFEFPKELTIQDYYRYTYGVLRIDDEEKPPETIIIRARGDCPNYLNDTPLHESQEIVEVTDEYTDFKLCMHPTRDFIGDILQQAGRIRVVSPQSLKDKLKAIAWQMYEAF